MVNKTAICFAMILTLVAVNARPVYATLVDIPDASLRYILKSKYPTCFVGNKMETACNDIVTETILDLNTSLTGLFIYDLSGIEYFIELKYLNCNGNALTSLPSLPSKLGALYCERNRLTSLPALPPGLEFLDCGNNLLTILPDLPNGLRSLDCGNNLLTILPDLPNGLRSLDCFYNKLTSLPPLPNKMFKLYCLGNQITNLPMLPNELTDLNCSENNLSALPTLPNGLTLLSCYSNKLTSLPDLSKNSMSSISCYYNKLTSLPAMPAFLHELYCYGNQLTSLPKLPSNLVTLDCSSNRLTTLVDLPFTLKSLQCYNNQLTSLPSLPGGLEFVSCVYNQLSTLPTLPTGLKYLYCSDNDLIILPALPIVLNELICSNNRLTTLPALPDGLKYLSCFDNQLTSFPKLPSELSVLNCFNNSLDFSDLEKFSFKPFSYLASPQTYSILPDSKVIPLGTSLVLDGTIGGSANQYKWYKNDVLIDGANSAIFTKTIADVDAGTYRCVVTSTAINSSVTNVIIKSSNVVVIAANQTITFPAIPVKKVGDAAFALSALATSGLDVSYSSSNSKVATLRGNEVTIVGAGIATITASQAGDFNYTLAPDISQILTVNKGNQTASFLPISAKTLGDVAFTLSATATSGLQVVFSSASDKIKIEGNQVTLLKAGSAMIQANQPGNNDFNAANEVTQTFCVNPAKPAISVEGILLTSNSPIGNQWYKDGIEINGATSPIITVKESGVYSVLVSVDNCVSARSEESAIVITGFESVNNLINVFPNPLEDILIVDVTDLNSTIPISLVLYDVIGRAVHTISGHGKIAINTSSYQSGVYVLKMQTDKVLGIKTLIKK
jgi:Leucine-rich repeat (LRR) protein